MNQARQQSCSRCGKWSSQRIKSLLSPKEYLSGRDNIWTSFGLPVPRLVFFPWHNTRHHGTHRPSHSRGWRCSLSALVWWSLLQFTPVLATICDPSEALSIMVFFEKLWVIKFSSSLSLFLSHIPFHWAKLCPSTILPNSLKSRLRHQVVFFPLFGLFFVKLSWPLYLRVLPRMVLTVMVCSSDR